MLFLGQNCNLRFKFLILSGPSEVGSVWALLGLLAYNHSTILGGQLL